MAIATVPSSAARSQRALVRHAPSGTSGGARLYVLPVVRRRSVIVSRRPNLIARSTRRLVRAFTHLGLVALAIVLGVVPMA
jgi:hypothetical protein